MNPSHKTASQGTFSHSDLRLIRECLQGNEQAWSNLINRYKNLVFSIPIKRGMSPDDATDIFQAVCLDLLSELPNIKHPEALPRWLVTVTYHKCVRWTTDRDRYSTDREEDQLESHLDTGQVADELLFEAERAQKIREVLAQLEPRCRQLIETLFFESPARPYREVAQSLGLALGSVGAVRERCLERARRLLEKAGIGE